ncbi:helix-turn-helix domain-containing protein [Lentzea flava]|uniref:HTH cro/C1-type domain-containing protein n=1 Tax=Lentzea flava TaxID=103732 RepID=A0ABQ2UHE9_9PSEU|nr:helix-turn-helix transcriptional regulator [Lentzea flava]MCP2199392.1 Transcriptional regulator, contains XRE-family HTH domain [Lentzea flava]GGU35537.1 hypothetical protein GCM10010178_29670 [Lentzea flava]
MVTLASEHHLVAVLAYARNPDALLSSYLGYASLRGDEHLHWVFREPLAITPADPSKLRAVTTTDGRPAFDAGTPAAHHLRPRSPLDLAERLGVSAAAVGQYEAGITKPRPDHLERLAVELDYPVAFLATGRPHARLDASMAHFRSLRTTRVSQRAKATAVVKQLWELVYALERRVEPPPVDLPVVPTSDIDKGPLRHLVRTMELKGVIVSSCR